METEQLVDLESILAAIDTRRGVFPVDALRAAQARRAEITPRLVEVLRGAIEQTRDGNPPETNRAFFAFYLLVEFQAAEALPLLVEAISLPGDRPTQLLGDGLIDDMGRILVALGADAELIDRLASDPSLDFFVRWSVISTYSYLVRDGMMTREDAVARLHEQLRRACDDKDGIATPLVLELSDHGAAEAWETIEQAYEQNLVDEFAIGDLDDQRDRIDEGDAGFQEKIRDLRPRGIVDAVEYLGQWACFQKKTRHRKRDWGDGKMDDLGLGNLLTFDAEEEEDMVGEQWDQQWCEAFTARGDFPRVGRNELCPCGSGKKFKKCCGRR